MTPWTDYIVTYVRRLDDRELEVWVREVASAFKGMSPEDLNTLAIKAIRRGNWPVLDRRPIKSHFDITPAHLVQAIRDEQVREKAANRNSPEALIAGIRREAERRRAEWAAKNGYEVLDETSG